MIKSKIDDNEFNSLLVLVVNLANAWITQIKKSLVNIKKYEKSRL
jgi:hypothetical protein